jgi:hypothetical protein
MYIRDRVKALVRVRAGALIPNERNWRTHPDRQKDALRGILAEVGYADALVAYETPAGLKLIDGHLRAETTPDVEVPVLVLDVSEDEARKLLATLDPLAGLAEADPEKLEALLRDVETESEALQAVFDDLATEAGIELNEDPLAETEDAIPDQFSVLVECDTEQQQAEVLGRLEGEGFRCRSLIS